MGDFEKRFQNEQYMNWLLAGQCMLSLCGGLETFIHKIVEGFHRELLTKYGNKTCGVCTAKRISRNAITCNNNVCDKWIADIAVQHQIKGQISWLNSDVSNWPIEPWEIAKCYMNPGQKKTNTGAKSSDCCALMNLISKCKKFHSHLANKKSVEEVRQVRNNLMHSAGMEISNSDLKRYTDKFINLLRDPIELASSQETKLAVQKIQLIVSKSATVPLQQQTENKILKQKFSDLELSLENDSEKETVKESIERFQCFINSQEDLKVIFQSEMSLLNEKIARLEGRVEHVEGRVDNLESSTSGMRHDIDSLTVKVDKLQTSPRKNGPNEASITENFVGLLQDYAQSKQMPLPEYYTTYDSLGYLAQVKVNGIVYKTIVGHPSKQLAKKMAAKEALTELGLFTDVSQGACASLKSLNTYSEKSTENSDQKTVHDLRHGSPIKTYEQISDQSQTRCQQEDGFVKKCQVDYKQKLEQHLQQLSLHKPQYFVEEAKCYGKIKFFVKLSVPERLSGLKKKEKKQAEKKLAMLALNKYFPFVTGKSVELCKNVLQEQCVKIEVDNLPDYGHDNISESEDSCSLYVKFLYALEISETSLDTKALQNLLAKQALSKLGVSYNVDKELSAYLSDFEESAPQFSFEGSSDRGYTANVTIEHKFSLKSGETYPSKKEAEKNLAKQVLNLVYPNVDTTALSNYKDILITECRKLENAPSYQTSHDNEGTIPQFTSSVVCKVKFSGDELCRDEETAKQHVANKVLRILKS